MHKQRETNRMSRNKTRKYFQTQEMKRVEKHEAYTMEGQQRIKETATQHDTITHRMGGTLGNLVRRVNTNAKE
jgi:hypothetical protein